MKKIFCGAMSALVLLLTVILSSCVAEKPHSASLQAMDTFMTLKLYGGDEELSFDLQARIKELDSLLDATEEHSEIFRLNTDGYAKVSSDTAALLDRSLQLCQALEPSFDVTVFPAVEAWGFLSGDYRIPEQEELTSLSQRIDYTAVQSNGASYTLSNGVMLDLGAVAKGYAADMCEPILRDGHATAAVLNLGGTVKLYGKKPDGSRFSVGVADPDNPAGYFGFLSCDGGVVATSGGYERYFERDGKRYIHILDPATARPVDNGILSVTIVSGDGTAADALSTALFVMGLDKATAYYRAHRDFDFIILTDDDNLYITEGIADDFTLSKGYDFTVKSVALQ